MLHLGCFYIAKVNKLKANVPGPHDEPLALIINAGGASRRMGQNKALLQLPGSNQTLIRSVADNLMPAVTDCIIVVGDVTVLEGTIMGLRVVHYLADRWPGWGPLGGLATALPLCASWAMVVACDMPFASPLLFGYLAQQTAPAYDAVVPLGNGRPQPFHALYHRRCAPALQRDLEGGVRAVQQWLHLTRVRYCHADTISDVSPPGGPAWWQDIDTPEAWRAAAGRLLPRRPTVPPCATPTPHVR